MDLPFYSYNFLLNTMGLGSLLLVRSRSMNDRAFYDGRLGNYLDAPKEGGHPRVWLHAASVGELTGILPTMGLLQDHLPSATQWLTVGTPHGFHLARKQVAHRATVLPFPLDFPWAVKRALDHLDPDIYVATESEFWPNLFHYLRLRRVPAILLNGRLTQRSTRRYKRLHPIFRPIFQQFRWLAMHSPEDRENALSLGASPERTMVLGTAKYDGLSMRVEVENAKRWRATLDIPPSSPVVVGGSLRGCECNELLGIFQRLRQREPNAIGIFAPRHMERVPAMVDWLEQHNVPFHLLSRLEKSQEPRRAPVVIVDRIGVLFDLYALGDLIFCGGTFEPIGGHNILEPAAWGKAVFYGPNISKVYQEHRYLDEASGSFMVQNAGELLQKWKYWVQRLDQLQSHGQKAKEAVGRLEGVAAKQVELILATLDEAGTQGFTQRQ